MKPQTTAELEVLRWLDSLSHLGPTSLAGEVKTKGLTPLVERLEELGLVTTGRGPRLTPKGRKWLEQIDEDALKMTKWNTNAGG